MIKRKFSDYTVREHGNRSLDEAISELDREMQVRRRLFDRWVQEGRMSWVDAHDRIERHMSALRVLIENANREALMDTGNNNPHPDDVGIVPAIDVDAAPTDAVA